MTDTVDTTDAEADAIDADSDRTEDDSGRTDADGDRTADDSDPAIAADGAVGSVDTLPGSTSSIERPSPVRAGVVGVGSMGQNHARIYNELTDVDLVGVADRDTERAHRVASQYGTRPTTSGDLLREADVVSVAVPTPAHYDVVRACIDAGTHVLVEKPFVDDPARGRDLARRAAEAGVTIQVGHVERFNPAVDALAEIVADLDVIAIDAQRLGPPLDRHVEDSVVVDLMIHDVDVVRSLVGRDPDGIAAASTADAQHATATLQFDDGPIATLTASRVTQKKVRTLTITAAECRVEVDYLDRSVLIHRKSLPEYVTRDGERRYRHESVVERPHVESTEPLKRELAAFVEAATSGSPPRVTATDGIRALEIVRTIDRVAAGEEVAVR